MEEEIKMNNGLREIIIAISYSMFLLGLMFGWSGAINRYYLGGLEQVCKPPVAMLSKRCGAADMEE